MDKEVKSMCDKRKSGLGVGDCGALAPLLLCERVATVMQVTFILTMANLKSGSEAK
jgi:hypothetical protein